MIYIKFTLIIILCAALFFGAFTQLDKYTLIYQIIGSLPIAVLSYLLIKPEVDEAFKKKPEPNK